MRFPTCPRTRSSSSPTGWAAAPQEIEDQITYPLSVKLQGLAGVKAVRSSSEFNFSMITIIFDDNDRLLLRPPAGAGAADASPATFLPPGVMPYLAPDATALGQIFWYTVEGDGHDLGRAAGDPGLVRPLPAQLASPAWPRSPRSAASPASTRSTSTRTSSAPTTSRLGELYSRRRPVELRRRRPGRSTRATPSTSSAASAGSRASTTSRTSSSPTRNGTPIYVKNVATVQLGPEFRRSVLEKDGNEVVGGVVLMRYGENPLEVTKRIKEKIQRAAAGPARGRADRAVLRPHAADPRRHRDASPARSRDEMIIASIAILLILMHFRSAFVVCMTLPLAVLCRFLLMRLLRHPVSNIMSLAGIAISIGILVDRRS